MIDLLGPSEDVVCAVEMQV